MVCQQERADFARRKFRQGLGAIRMPYPALKLPLVCCVLIGAESVAAPAVEQSEIARKEAQALDAGAIAILRQARAKDKAGEMRRVIVTLRLEGIEPTNKVAIAELQDRIMSVVTKLGATVERKYTNMPQLALTVTPQALAELRRSNPQFRRL